MARSAFESVIQLQLDRYGSPEAVKRKHIAIARDILARELAGQQEKPGYIIETDGHPASSETQVRPFGVIIYRFRRMPEIGRYGKREWIRLAPKKSGDYAKSITIFADMVEVGDNIPINAKELLIVATVPYARKIQVRGARLRGVPPGIAEKVVQLVRRKYGATVQVSLRFISLSSGYKLKRPRGGRDGRQLSYPAVSIITKF